MDAFNAACPVFFSLRHTNTVHVSLEYGVYNGWGPKKLKGSQATASWLQLFSSIFLDSSNFYVPAGSAYELFFKCAQLLWMGHPGAGRLKLRPLSSPSVTDGRWFTLLLPTSSLAI